MFYTRLKSKFFKTNIGLLPLTEDKRDLGAFKFWGLSGLGYQRKQEKKIIEYPFEAKNQQYNTCGWTGEVSMKEVDEKVELSPRSFVLAGKMLGYISGDGFSNLRGNEMTLKNLGVSEKKYLVETNTGWDDYSNLRYFSKEVRENAKIHRSKSFLRLYNNNQVDKAIDEGRPVSFGMRWYTGFNMSGGFKSPWIVKEPKGYFVGGHKMSIRGYDGDLYIVRNSFGPKWASNGDLFVHRDFMDKQIDLFGAYINYDLDKTVVEWVIENNGLLVRTREKSTVYYITDGKKRPFMSYGDLKRFLELTPIFHYPEIDPDIKYVNKDILDQVPLGREMLK